jgi:hypothetical protein
MSFIIYGGKNNLKNRVLLLSLLISIIIVFDGCDKNLVENTNQLKIQTDKPHETPPIISDNSKVSEDEVDGTDNSRINSDTDKKENINQYFFKDISPTKQYVYTGTIWGNNILGDKSEDIDDEGGVRVTANLIISEVAKLSKGKIYVLEFSINGTKNNTKEKDEKLYLWVTEDAIYNCSFKSSDDAKKLEINRQLPNVVNDSILFSKDKMRFTNGAWETEIKIVDNKCTYDSYDSGSGSYSKYVWEIGKGIKVYSWGYGARQAGMDLHLR